MAEDSRVKFIVRIKAKTVSFTKAKTPGVAGEARNRGGLCLSTVSVDISR